MSYLDKEHLLSLGNIDPELETFLKFVALPPPNYSDLKAFKKMSAQRDATTLEKSASPPPGIKQTELQYPTRDGEKIRAKLYQPLNASADHRSPLIIMFHGGGFCVGCPESEEQSCLNFVQAFGATCVSAGYRLAPEFPFPQAVYDAWDALKWVTQVAPSWGSDLSAGFIVGGTSAGGNIAAVLAHLARDEGLVPPLTGQYLAVPILLPPSVVPHQYEQYYLSYEQNRNGPILPKAAIDMFLGGYKPDDNDSVLWAIFNHPKGHKQLPPALFQIDGMDLIRDDGLIYERVLREECGVKTKRYVYPGLPHGHWTFFPSLKSSEKFRTEQVEGMGWLLGQAPDFSKVAASVQSTSV